ncbi:hypothetical protein [Micromonospora sp. SH-82]|uniref:hypothetical protein n=1 Tax=Micromonospora sp. SH-82 TaxID=3132938 RepID=UPI003EB8DF89
MRFGRGKHRQAEQRRHAERPRTPHGTDWAYARTAAYPVVRPGTDGHLTPAQAWRANQGRSR